MELNEVFESIPQDIKDLYKIELIDERICIRTERSTHLIRSVESIELETECFWLWLEHGNAIALNDNGRIYTSIGRGM